MELILIFITTFLMQLLVTIEMNIIGPLAPFLANHFSINDSMVILFNLGYSAVGLLVPYLGLFADKHGKKKSLIISLFLFIFGTTLAGFSKSPYVFAFARIFIGFSFFSISGANLSYISEFISYKNRGKASGFLRVAFGIAILSSPLYTAFLVNKYNNLQSIYIPLAIVGAIALLLLIKLPETEKSNNIKIDGKEFLSLLKNPLASKVLLSVFLLLTAPSLILNYLSVYLSNSFNLSQVNIGMSYTLVALGSSIGIAFSALFSDKIGKFKLSKVFFTIMFIAMIPILYINSLGYLIGFTMIFALGLDGGWTSYQTFASEVLPKNRGTFMSMFYTINAITVTFYSLFGPLLYNFGGFKLILTISLFSVFLAVAIISRFKIVE